MLDRFFLDRWVSIIVPDEYGPDKILENGKPLLAITLYSPEEMDKYKNRFYPDATEKDELRGHILNMAAYMEYVGAKDYEKFKGRYLIKINEGLSEESGIYCLLHEIGHLSGYLTEDPDHVSDADEYADNYALRKAKELIKDPSLRLKVILEGLTNDFKHR